MGKKNNDTPKVKKGPDMTAQKVKKAKNAFKSGGKRGLDAFLGQNPDIKSNKVVIGLIAKAATLKVKPPKGKRGPASNPKAKQPAKQPA